MASSSTTPPYNGDGNRGTNETTIQALAKTISTKSDFNSNDGEVKEAQPQILLIVSMVRNKKQWERHKLQRDAVMLSPSSTYEESLAHFAQRYTRRKPALGLPNDAKPVFLLYYLVQDGDKDPWLESTRHNRVLIDDEESWRACKALLVKNERSLLMLCVFPEPDALTGEDAHDLEDHGRTCVLQ